MPNIVPWRIALCAKKLVKIYLWLGSISPTFLPYFFARMSREAFFGDWRMANWQYL
jgi:hypothetical protein